MFDRLQKKWKVNGLQLVLILCTFAIGGSLTGYVGKILMNLFNIEQRALWVIIYILLVTIIWPMAVLLISIPFGQYRFFTGYLKKMGRRMGVGSRESGVGSQDRGMGEKSEVRSQRSEVKSENNISGDPASSIQYPASNIQHPARLPTPDPRLPTQIALFASGAGSNAQKIIDYFRDSDRIRVALIVCNNPKAGVLSIAARENIPYIIIDKENFFRGDAYLPTLKQHGIDLIVLAGFLWKVPEALIDAYPNKIINIHPALLPGYGGKGMYGNHVHEAVIAAGEKESGITIHYVDGHYDNGDIIFQARCAVLPGDTATDLAERIHKLEHEHYPRVIEEVVFGIGGRLEH